MKNNKVLIALTVCLAQSLFLGAAGGAHLVKTGTGQTLEVAGGKQKLVDVTAAANAKAVAVKAAIVSDMRVDAITAANQMQAEIVEVAEQEAEIIAATDPSKAQKLIADAKALAKEEAAKLLAQATDAAKKVGTKVVEDTMAAGKEAFALLQSKGTAGTQEAIDLIKDKAGTIATDAFTAAKGEVATIAKNVMKKAKSLLGSLFK